MVNEGRSLLYAGVRPGYAVGLLVCRLWRLTKLLLLTLCHTLLGLQVKHPALIRLGVDQNHSDDELDSLLRCQLTWNPALREAGYYDIAAHERGNGAM